MVNITTVSYTHLFSCKTTLSSYELYRDLRRFSPAPFGAFLNFEHSHILSNSPERFIKCVDTVSYTHLVLWTTVDARDWQNPAAEVIANKIINNAKNGDIILLHDYATNNTVAALDILIPKMMDQGFEFVTVSQIIDK